MKNLVIAGLVVMGMVGAARADFLLVIISTPGGQAVREAKIYQNENQLDADVAVLADTTYRNKAVEFSKHNVNLNTTQTEKFEFKLQKVAK